MSVQQLTPATIDKTMWVSTYASQYLPAEWEKDVWHYGPFTSKDGPLRVGLDVWPAVSMLRAADLRYALEFLNDLAYWERYKTGRRPVWLPPSLLIWSEPRNTLNYLLDWWHRNFAEKNGYSSKNQSPEHAGDGSLIYLMLGSADATRMQAATGTLRPEHYDRVLMYAKAAECWRYNTIEGVDLLRAELSFATATGRTTAQAVFDVRQADLEAFELCVHRHHREAYARWLAGLADDDKRSVYYTPLTHNPLCVAQRIETQLGVIYRTLCHQMPGYANAPWNGN